MKKITIILTVVTCAVGVQIAQADTAGTNHLHEDHTHRGSLFQTISASDRLNFRDESQNNMELMSTQERQTFMNNMNSGQGMGQGGMGQGGMGQGGMGQGGMGQGGMGQGGMGRGGMGQGGGGHGGR
jgi:hypothetical protein